MLSITLTSVNAAGRIRGECGRTDSALSGPCRERLPDGSCSQPRKSGACSPEAPMADPTPADPSATATPAATHKIGVSRPDLPVTDLPTPEEVFGVRRL